jgi:predicted dehydrogenase
MLKVAIIGCGKIADTHAAQIRRIDGCEIVGVCDREYLMAKQIYERFPVKQYFTQVGDLISKVRPDVVHITTPPESHFDLAKLCLEENCNIYVEKPFTLYTDQADQLIRLANAKRLKLTVGHNDQFSHAARHLRSLVEKGYLGERPIHMESYYGYDLGDPSYAKALLGDKHHWVRRLPGGLLQNVISHGIAKIAEFLKGNEPQVFAHGFQSTLLKGIGEDEITDELRVVIADQEGTTAYLTFSSQMRPLIHEFRMYGSKNGLILDQDHEVVLQLRGQRYKSYADRFIPPVVMATQYLGNVKRNVKLFLNMDFHMDSGMKYLIESFYRSVRDGAPLPISYREILVTARIMDSIFKQLNRSHVKEESEAPANAALAAC